MKKFIAIGLILVSTGGVLFLFGERNLDIVGAAKERIGGVVRPAPPEPSTPALPKSPLTGLPCAHAERRPLAVMLATDPVTRPLAGISEADVVIEMPVTLHDITRLLALYQCAQPKELGSIRSARHDFLPFAAGFDAIYSHWGGSHFAREKLATKVIDNIDALVNPYDAYYRKRGVAAPHNGFTSYERLWQAAEKMRYRQEIATPKAQSQTFKTVAQDVPTHTGVVAGLTRTIAIPYNPNGFAVRWDYEGERGIYKRVRAGRPEIDKNTGSQVEASVVIVMRTSRRHIEGEYTDVKVIGSGEAAVYQGGKKIPARWQKTGFTAPLLFVDAQSEAIPLVAGKRWIEVVAR